MTDKEDRPMPVITQEYGQAAAQLGSLKYQKEIQDMEYNSQSGSLIEKMRLLNQEAAALKAKEAQTAETPKPHVEVITPEAVQ